MSLCYHKCFVWRSNRLRRQLDCKSKETRPLPLSWVPKSSMPTTMVCSLSKKVNPVMYVALFGPPRASFVQTCNETDLLNEDDARQKITP